MKYITVTLNPALDMNIALSGPLATEGLNRSVGAAFSPGGKGINVSKTVFALGGKTLALGILGGALAGILVNMVYAYATISLCANHTVYGMAINILAPALASFIYRVYFGTGSSLYKKYASWLFPCR